MENTPLFFIVRPCPSLRWFDYEINKNLPFERVTRFVPYVVFTQFDCPFHHLAI